MFAKYIEDLANNKEIYLRIKVVPGAGKTGLLEIMADETIKLAIAAAPEKGQANKELLKFLADTLGIRKYQVKIISGAGSRLKLVKITR